MSSVEQLAATARGRIDYQISKLIERRDELFTQPSGGVRMNILTPLGDNAKFVVVKQSAAVGYALMFVDGHGFSRAIAYSSVTDPQGTELAWLGSSAAKALGIGFEREEPTGGAGDPSVERGSA